jgi:hypothetical protein
LATPIGAALVLVEPGRLDPSEIARVIRRRFAGAVVQSSAPVDAVLTSVMAVADATELGIIRRGAEPLRIVIPPQRPRRKAPDCVEPMPICFG